VQRARRTSKLSSQWQGWHVWTGEALVAPLGLAILHRMQQMERERTNLAPIWQFTFINGVGSGVAACRFRRITAPYNETCA